MLPNVEVTVDGTLRNDGTLELHEKPNLAPGPVTVILVPAATKASKRPSISDTISDIKARQQRRGYTGLTAKDLEQLQQEREADDVAYDDRWHDDPE